ncbi:MAG: cation diffusion facilitator family transporter [Armatimonadota bacterium]
MASGSIKTAAAKISILSNISLVILKLIVGGVTNSVSIMAEAIHSAVDLAAAIIAFFAVRVADEPPDEVHAFGHGKYENVSGTIEAFLIIIAAVYVGYESIRRIIEGVEVKRALAGIIVMLVSALANFIVSTILFKVSSETDSIALEADGHHLRLDVFTSIGVLIGLIVVYITGISLIDQMLGIGVALWIGWIGIQLSAKALHPLLDQQLPSHELQEIQTILDTDPRILGYHKLRTRKSGAQRHIDVHILVSSDLSVGEAHNLAENVEDRIRGCFSNAFVLTHVEPEDEDSSG